MDVWVRFFLPCDVSSCPPSARDPASFGRDRVAPFGSDGYGPGSLSNPHRYAPVENLSRDLPGRILEHGNTIDEAWTHGCGTDWGQGRNPITRPWIGNSRTGDRNGGFWKWNLREIGAKLQYAAPSTASNVGASAVDGRDRRLKWKNMGARQERLFLQRPTRIGN